MRIEEIDDFEYLTKEEMQAIEDGIKEYAKMQVPEILAKASRGEKLELIDRMLLRIARERVMERTRKGRRG